MNILLSKRKSALVALMTLAVFFGICDNRGAQALSTQSAADFQFSFNSSITINLSSSDVTIPSIMPGNYASSNTIAIDIETNNGHGYTLFAKVGDKNDATLANNNLVNTTHNAVFTSLEPSDKIALASFNDGKWGYTTSSSVDASSTYSGLLYGTDTIINATTTNTGTPAESYPGTNTTSFTIGAKASPTQISGEYGNVINFRGVANVSTDPTIETTEYLQDFSNMSADEKDLVLESMNTGQAYQLKDNRDDIVYNVAKLKDGGVWLLDNLALGSATLKNALSTDNTNMSPSISFALPSSSAGTEFESYTLPKINTDYKNTTVNLGLDQSGTAKVGVYYNYCAASAGTWCMNSSSWYATDWQYDICPKGWKIPTGYNTGEYQALLDSYSTSSEFVTDFRFPYSGEYIASNGAASNLNSVGRMLSSTIVAKYGTTMSFLSNIGVDNNLELWASNSFSNGAGTGSTIRCKLK